MPRSPTDHPVSDAKLCPQCGRTYPASDRFCTVDGAALMASGTSDSLIGAVLAERYLVRERLGEGGMGEVYLAEHVRMKRKVAVKLMRPWMAGDPLAVSRFHREAENASQITHPNVAQVYDFGETAEGALYLAMEYVPGEPLSAILDREKRLNAVRTAEIVRQTAEALVAAHGMGILHRDLKPDNVMVARARNGADIVKLVDFGIARIMSRGTQQFTSTGIVIGTPEYMSPEQLAGDNLDERSDLYALALIAFRALTGHAAFPEGTGGEAIVARLTNRARPLHEVMPDVAWPLLLQDAFTRALDADPARRFADAMEFAMEVDAAISQMPLSEEERSYLVLLAQRTATPTRLSALRDAHTPARAMSALRTPTPVAAQPAAMPAAPGIARDRPPVVTDPDMQGSAAAPTALAAASWTTGVPSAGAQFDAAHAAAGIDAAHAVGVAVVATATARRVASRTRRLGFLSVGALVIVALAYASFHRRPSAVDADAGASQALAVADSIAGASSTPLPALVLPEASPRDSTVPLDVARIAKARSGVFQVLSAAGRGSAFLVDSGGILFTAASLVPPDNLVQVFVDADHTLHASVLTVDRRAGVAALLVSATKCPRCRTVVDEELAGATPPSVAVGDLLLVLSATGRTAVGMMKASISRSSSTGLGLVAPMGALALGAPLLTPAGGRVAGVATSRRAAASAPVLRALLRTARAAAHTTTPNDTLYRTWPATVVAAGQLEGAESLGAAALAEYRVEQGGFSVFVMTPTVWAWRVAQSPSNADVPANVFAIEPPATLAPDPLSAWGGWNGYRNEHRAVVIIEVTPKDAAFPSRPAKALDWRRGDVVSVTLKRDSDTLVPLESQRVPAVTNLEPYRRDAKARVPSSAVYVFHPTDFVPASGQYSVEIMDAEKSRRVRVDLPAAILQRIATELQSWQRK
ncbi:MAG: serine/threonine-protein kinase [Gemmatimonadaceae bacterium]